MNTEELIAWLKEESYSAGRDYDKATDPVDAEYHLGRMEAYDNVISYIKGE